MVPSVQKLTDLGSSKDQFSCEDGVSVNFLHNINPHLTTLNQCYHSDMTLFELLRGFFDFYSHFEFNKHALNTISGETEEKNKLWPKTSALDILNPLGKYSIFYKSIFKSYFIFIKGRKIKSFKLVRFILLTSKIFFYFIKALFFNKT